MISLEEDEDYVSNFFFSLKEEFFSNTEIWDSISSEEKEYLSYLNLGDMVKTDCGLCGIISNFLYKRVDLGLFFNSITRKKVYVIYAEIKTSKLQDKQIPITEIYKENK